MDTACRDLGRDVHRASMEGLHRSGEDILVALHLDTWEDIHTAEEGEVPVEHPQVEVSLAVHLEEEEEEEEEEGVQHRLQTDLFGLAMLPCLQLVAEDAAVLREGLRCVQP